MITDIGKDCFDTYTVLCAALVLFLTGTTYGYFIASAPSSAGTLLPLPWLLSSGKNKNDEKTNDEKDTTTNNQDTTTNNQAEKKPGENKVKIEKERLISVEHAEQATKAALTAVNEVTLNEKSVPQFEYEQLDIGKLLGKGKFSDVYEVIGTNQESSRQTVGNDKDESLHPSDNNNRLEYQYAVKQLRWTTMHDSELFKTGAIELAVEAKLLSCIHHPHIIRIHGVSDGGLSGFTAGTEGCYFVLLDKLEGTLEERLYRSWKEKQAELRKRRAVSINKMFAKDDKRGERREFFIQRLSVAFDIATALAHLHSLNIVHRALQPGNIGFDCRGDVKIFNLSQARELHPDEHHNGKLSKITGSVGSIRYMAPEMALGRPYGLAADVYSFTIILWEILSIKKPYDTMTRHAHSLLVVKNDERPSIDLSLSFRLRSLLKTGWSKRTKERPKMASICKDLEKEMRKRMTDSSISSSSSMVSSKRPSFGSSHASLLEEELYSSLEFENLNGSSSSFTYD